MKFLNLYLVSLLSRMSNDNLINVVRYLMYHEGL